MSDLKQKLLDLQVKVAARPPRPVPPPTSKVTQLPIWPEATRGLPNALARSSLFAVQSRGRARVYVKNALISTMGNLQITYTGEQLRQDDEDVFLQLLHLARSSPLGDRVAFSAYSMLKALGWPTRGQNHYDRLRASIERLSATGLNVSSTAEGFNGSLVRKFTWRSDDGSTALRSWTILLEPEIIQLFGDVNYTQIDWQQRLSLGPLAKWLHSFYFTHARPYPLKVVTLHHLCGSDARALRTFRQSLKGALDELVEIGFLARWTIDDGDLVHVSRTKQLSDK